MRSCVVQPSLQTFRRDVLPSLSRAFLYLLTLEMEGNAFLRKVGKNSTPQIHIPEDLYPQLCRFGCHRTYKKCIGKSEYIRRLTSPGVRAAGNESETAKYKHFYERQNLNKAVNIYIYIYRVFQKELYNFESL